MQPSRCLRLRRASALVSVSLLGGCGDLQDPGAGSALASGTLDNPVAVGTDGTGAPSQVSASLPTVGPALPSPGAALPSSSASGSVVADVSSPTEAAPRPSVPVPTGEPAAGGAGTLPPVVTDVSASGDGGASGRSGSAPLASAGPNSAGGAGPAAAGEAGAEGVEPGSGGFGGAVSGEQDPRFELLWQDDFDTVDTARWSLQTHSWDGNLAQFSTSNAVAENGVLRLMLSDAPAGSEKPYLGVEYRSVDTITFGRVEARVRFASGSAVVSSLVLLYTPWPPDDWNELDIEYLGRNSGEVQFNHMINIPPADPETGHLQFPQLVDLGFDPSADFHDYVIEWVPGAARFIVDGQLRHEALEEMSRMVLPQNILLTIWASDAPDWAGPVDSTTSPASVDYDWLRVYRYVEP